MARRKSVATTEANISRHVKSGRVGATSQINNSPKKENFAPEDEVVLSNVISDLDCTSKIDEKYLLLQKLDHNFSKDSLKQDSKLLNAKSVEMVAR